MPADTDGPNISRMDDKVHRVTECASNATVTWSEPTVSDNSGYYTLISNHTPGQTFPYGNTEVTYTATDPSNNMGSVNFTVTVIVETGMYC